MRRIALAIAATSLLAIPISSAEAHTSAFSASCGSATVNWASFAGSGAGNGGMNTPAYNYTFNPASGAPTTGSGNGSFAGTSSSLTTPLPAVNGSITISTSWTAGTTRDNSSGGSTQTLSIGDCRAITPSTPDSPPAVNLPANPGTSTPRQAKKKKKKKKNRRVKAQRSVVSPFTG